MNSSNDIVPGDAVKFVFWSKYLAPSAWHDEHGHKHWFELHPGDVGIVVASDAETYAIIFSGINQLVRLRAGQLERIEGCNNDFVNHFLPQQ